MSTEIQPDRHAGTAFARNYVSQIPTTPAEVARLKQAATNLLKAQATARERRWSAIGGQPKPAANHPLRVAEKADARRAGRVGFCGSDGSAP